MSHTTAGPAPTTNGGDTNKDRIPHPLTTHRRVVQVHRVIGEENARWQGVLVTTVLCNDGSMWEMWNDGAWTRLPDVPQHEEKGQQERLAAVAPSPKASGEMQGSPPAPVASAPMSLGAVVEAHVLDAFAEYWRENYHDGCVIANREWHLPKFQGAIKRALREVHLPVATRDMLERVSCTVEELAPLRMSSRDRAWHMLRAAGFTVEEGA